MSSSKFADIEGLAHLPLDLPTGSDLIADAAYTQYEWAEYLKTEGFGFWCKQEGILVKRLRLVLRNTGGIWQTDRDDFR